MNNKGFTVVELLASFTLTMIIMIFLFEIVLQLKDVYITNSLKTKIITQNAIIASTLNDKLSDISSADCNKENNSCSINNSANFISINSADKSIKIDTQTIKYPKYVEGLEVTDLFESNTIPDNSLQGDNSFIRINYIIKSNYLDKPMTFNYVYTFKTR